MTLMDEIITPSTNGKDHAGKFQPGNKLGKGNPLAKYVQRNRVLLLKNAKPDDILDIFNALVTKAKAGDVQAAREVLDRVCGKPMDEVSKDEQNKVIQMFLTQVNNYAGAPPAKQIDSVTTSTNAGARAEASANDNKAGAPIHTHDAQSSTPGEAKP